MPVKSNVLLVAEEVEQGTLRAGRTLEVSNRSRIHIDPADATHFSNEAAGTRRRHVETFRATA